MKKILLTAAATLMLFSCQTESTDAADSANSVTELRMCASQEVLEAQLVADPTLALRMNEIEAFTQKSLSNKNFRLVNGKIEIPVVVNVLYRTAAENIDSLQIESQIAVLNQDFTQTNSEFNVNSTAIFGDFKSVAANVDITFKLVKINRKPTTKKSWGTRDAMKITKQGGIAPTSPTTTLNFWVCTIGGGILGYAQFPGGSSATDGIVCDSKYVGVTSNSGGAYPYNLGRTATHEVGHWMNLRHIWGDATCGSDLVSDTPTHNTANYGVPFYPHYNTCSVKLIEMTMNYMDYTDDRGMYMFTNGQKSRMSAIFVSGGSRSGFGI